jgi:SulP family sulfate permease
MVMTPSVALHLSKQLINGPTNVISIAVLSALAWVPPEGAPERRPRARALVGAVAAAHHTLLRIGDLTRYISHSVVVGFPGGQLLSCGTNEDLFGWGRAGQRP